MNIQINGQNVVVTTAIKDYIINKYSKIEKVLSPIDNIHVSISVDQHHQRGEIFTVSTQLSVGKHSIHVKETASDTYAAVDLSKEVLLRQAKKYKSKDQVRLRRIRRALSPRNYLRWGKKMFRR